jgi:hypothetical protein
MPMSICSRPARWLEIGTAGSDAGGRLDGKCAASDLIFLVRVANPGMSAFGPIGHGTAETPSGREVVAA